MSAVGGDGQSATLAENRWTRPPGDFAVRIDASSVQPNTWWRDRQLTVEHGTRAMIFQAGVYKGEVPEGRYEMGGFLKKLNNFLVDQGMVAILIDAGDVTLDLESGNLRSSDGFEIGVRLRMVLRLVDPDAMFVNLMKGRSVVRLSDPTGNDLESQLSDEAQMVLKAVAARYTADELFASLEIRRAFETQLRDHLSDTLARLGFALSQLRFLDFEGARYSRFNEQRAELQLREREQTVERNRTQQDRNFQQTLARDEMAAAIIDADMSDERRKLNARLCGSLTQEKIDAFKNESDFQQFVLATEHELGLNEVVRDDEMARVVERFAFDRNREGLLRRFEIEGITAREKRAQALDQLQAEERLRDETLRNDLRRRLELATNDIDRRKLELELERLEHAEQLRRAEAELQFGRAAHDEQLRRDAAEQDLKQKKALSGIEMLRQVKQMEAEEDRHDQELEAARLSSRSGASAAALLSIMDGASPDKLIELERLRAQEKLSPEQMLAMAAQASPEAARALAARYQADGAISAQRAELVQTQLADQQKQHTEHADRLERIMQTAMTQMGQVATTRSQAPATRQTIVTPGGGQNPVVINAATSPATCRHCGAGLEAGARFCAECGKTQ